MASTIEHYESKGEDWRAAFYERLVDGMAELKQERAAQVKRRLYHGTQIYIVKDLTDAEIETLARLEAERTCEQAINEQKEAKRLAKLHRGEAL